MFEDGFCRYISGVLKNAQIARDINPLSLSL